MLFYPPWIYKLGLSTFAAARGTQCTRALRPEGPAAQNTQPQASGLLDRQNLRLATSCRRGLSSAQLDERSASRPGAAQLCGALRHRRTPTLHRAAPSQTPGRPRAPPTRRALPPPLRAYPGHGFEGAEGRRGRRGRCQRGGGGRRPLRLTSPCSCESTNARSHINSTPCRTHDCTRTLRPFLALTTTAMSLPNTIVHRRCSGAHAAPLQPTCAAPRRCSSLELQLRSKLAQACGHSCYSVHQHDRHRGRWHRKIMICTRQLERGWWLITLIQIDQPRSLHNDFGIRARIAMTEPRRTLEHGIVLEYRIIPDALVSFTLSARSTSQIRLAQASARTNWHMGASAFATPSTVSTAYAYTQLAARAGGAVAHHPYYVGIRCKECLVCCASSCMRRPFLHFALSHAPNTRHMSAMMTWT
jgi:hypothetical protein